MSGTLIMVLNTLVVISIVVSAIIAVQADKLIHCRGAVEHPNQQEQIEYHTDNRRNQKFNHFQILPIHFSMVPLMMSPAFSRSISATSIQCT